MLRKVVAITLRSEPHAPAAFSFGRDATVFVDPYTSRVLGEGGIRARALFRTLTEWHRWLGASGESRKAGRAVTGASNLVFLLIVVTGIVVWWPRGWAGKHLRPVTLALRRFAAWRRRRSVPLAAPAAEPGTAGVLPSRPVS
jgi:uncharacterized iron-regulated membrane protein